ncbi:MAG: TolC family protein [Comamonadaceae bacterium]|nr:TolC family protein [Comamonadaceae bacterium]
MPTAQDQRSGLSSIAHGPPFQERHRARRGALLAACAGTPPQPVDDDAIRAQVGSDRVAARADVRPPANRLTLDEAIARALKFSLDRRARQLEEALALHQHAEIGYDRLPELFASAGYTARDEDRVSRSIDSVTGAPSLANASISQERNPSPRSTSRREPLAGARRQFERADSLSRLDAEILEQTRRREEARAGSKLDRVAAQTTAIVSRLRRFQALAQWHAAAGRLQATLGVDALPQSTDIATGRQEIDQAEAEVAKTGAELQQIRVQKRPPPPAAIAPVLGSDSRLDDAARRVWREALSRANETLAALPERADFAELLRQSFGSAGTDAEAFARNVEALGAALRDGGLRLTAEVRGKAELQGAWAACTAQGPDGSERLHVTAVWLQRGASVADVARALLEEAGHAFDQHVNDGADSAADEGERFAVLAGGGALNAMQAAALDAFADVTELTLDGIAVEVEFAQLSVPFSDGFIGQRGWARTATRSTACWPAAALITSRNQSHDRP